MILNLVPDRRRGLAMLLAAALVLPWSAAAADHSLFARSNLVAWCIVPFDARKRGPEERAAMLERLGITQLAYDYRAEHIPSFDAEMEALKRHHIRLLAWWFPGELNDEARLILDVLQRHQLRGVQLWVSGSGEPTKTAEEQAGRVAAEAQRLKPICEAAAPIGSTVALYNHGGWFGEPENQLAIIERLRAGGVTNVGIVYNQHHGHDQLDRFPQLLAQMKPYLLALNLNGMARDGEKTGRKILPLGQGDFDPALLAIVRDSGWRGPIGILNHTDEDAEGRLLDNLDGLDWLLRQEPGHPVGAKPTPRTWRESSPPTSASQAVGVPSLALEFGRALSGGMVVPGRPEYRALPLTIECRARLRSRSSFNILVACDPKASAEHWELYSYAGSGVFSLYQPGRGGEFKTEVNICDDAWHHLAATLETNRVRLWVDGRLALDQPAPPQQGTPVPGGLAFGQLVEGTIGCDGLMDDVRISRGVRELAGATAKPLVADAPTLGLWSFDGLSASAGSPARSKYWAVEDRAARERLPLYQTIPAATPAELTPANGLPKPETYRTWHRSHGDNGGTRFSLLDQINRQNVTNLQVAWTYHSKDGKDNIQCNPIVVDGVMYTPTPGRFIAAVNAETGVERWRFKPEGRPAWRGLIFWPGDQEGPARLLFCSGKHLYALDPRTGQPIASFGDNGRALLPGVAQGDFGAATACPTIFEHIVVVPGFEKDVWGFDLLSGKHLWTFHTVPQPGEFGYDTWDRAENYGANCWGGMAMDEARGIAYVTTGSPKPNFTGMYHLGDNLFANCLIALDARTGRRLWHCQEIRHDIWDLDIPAPPNLATITRNGRRVDVVAACTKIGNTLLLDRVTGKPVFPFRLRRAPTSDVPGEVTTPYQPDLELPEPFSKQEYTEADLTDRTDEAADYALTRFRSMNTGWLRPCSEGKSTIFFNIDGGAEWTGACVDQATGRLYVTANHIGWTISLFRDDDPPHDPQAPKTRGREVFEQMCVQCHGANLIGIGMFPALRGVRHRMTFEAITNQVRVGKNAMPAHPDMPEADVVAVANYLLIRDRPLPPPGPEPERPRYGSNGYPKFYDHEGYPANKPPWGSLNCLDLNTGKLLWKVPLGEYPELTAEGVPKTGTENYGGAIVTAGGLVFCAGTRDHKIRAFDKDSGAELWAARLPYVGNSPPTTYEVNGHQYVVISASGGNKLGTPYGDAWVAFALPK